MIYTESVGFTVVSGDKFGQTYYLVAYNYADKLLVLSVLEGNDFRVIYTKEGVSPITEMNGPVLVALYETGML